MQEGVGRENDNARSFSMTTSRIEMARKMATAPKGEIFEVSNFISLLFSPFYICFLVRVKNVVYPIEKVREIIKKRIASSSVVANAIIDWKNWSLPSTNVT